MGDKKYNSKQQGAVTRPPITIDSKDAHLLAVVKRREELKKIENKKDKKGAEK